MDHLSLAGVGGGRIGLCKNSGQCFSFSVKAVQEMFFTNLPPSPSPLKSQVATPKDKQKSMCVSGSMLLKIRVGRIIFLIFEIIIICLKYFL